MSNQQYQHIARVDELFEQHEEEKQTKGQPTGPVVLINMFTVLPENQQKLVDISAAHSRNAVCKFPGFISAKFHTSLDGTRVVGVFCWESQEACFAFTKSPGARAVFEESGPLIQHTDIRFYTLAADIVPYKELQPE